MTVEFSDLTCERSDLVTQHELPGQQAAADVRRAARDPRGLLAGLPLAVARQPTTFARELWALVRR